MPRQVQICPHCGASISGSPQQCPRCDGPLNAIPQSIAELGPIGPETEEMISSQSATTIAPVPANPIEDEHEDDVVLWRPTDSTSESKKSSPENDVNSNPETIDVAVEPDEAIQEESEDPQPQPLASDEFATQDNISTSDHEATAFDAVQPDSEDAEDNDNAPFETQMEVETQFDEEPEPVSTSDDSISTDLVPDEVLDEIPQQEEVEESISFATEPPATESGIATAPDEPPMVTDEDTSPHAAVALDEDTKDHIPVQSDEVSPQTMSDDERAAFENAQTAMLPAEESPMMPTPTQAHPRPAEPVPEPTPLPLLSSMDTEPKVEIPEAPPIPSAPYTPPPPLPAAPPSSAFPAQQWQNLPSNYWLQQRMEAYLYGGYQIREQRPTEATLAYGKSISFFWWVFAVMSVVGLLWYLFILLLSGFRKDTVYIYLERDGYVYEEGPGAAHIRRRRSRVARRWGVMGILLAVFSTFTIIIMVVSIAILMSRYQAELASAYPESSFIQGNVNTDNLDETQVQNVKVIVPVIIVMSTLSVVGFIGGIAMSIISYLHSAAYRVEVAPLPDLR